MKDWKNWLLGVGIVGCLIMLAYEIYIIKIIANVLQIIAAGG